MFGHEVGNALKLPVLMPVFPRPWLEWKYYTHSLDRDTLLIDSGDMKRIDLQLIAMIQDAQKLLSGNGIKVEQKVFMTGFSASASFVNRFAQIHPEKVRALAYGDFPTLCIKEWQGTRLPFPVGIADLKEITGKEFNVKEYKKISQFCFLGDQDNNSTTPADGDSREIEDIWFKIYGNQPVDVKTKWNKIQEIIKKSGFGDSIQFVLVQGVGHGIAPNTYKDAIEFFRVNSGNTNKKIQAHTNPN